MIGRSVVGGGALVFLACLGEGLLLKQLATDNFLNIIDIFCDESSDFVISEFPRGRLIAELHSERSPSIPDDVLALMRPLADALDLIAASGMVRMNRLEVQRIAAIRLQILAGRTP